MSNDKYLIENSTKEERQKRIDDAIVISMLDAPAPSQETMNLYQKYIDGEMELDEIQRILIAKFTVK